MNNEQKKWLTVAEMAKISGLTRQTLLYYDSIDLFKPAYVDQKGYRKYSAEQIPFIREICYLKESGVSLKEIADNIQERSILNTKDLLLINRTRLKKQIRELQNQINSVENRLNLYKKAEEAATHVDHIFMKHFEERKIVFVPWNVEEMDKNILHLTLMQAWNILRGSNMKVDNGWGTKVCRASIEKGEPLVGAGSYVNLPDNYDETLCDPVPNMQVIPAGEFVCMSKFGMPYDFKDLTKMVAWIGRNGYEIIGDALDECFLDTTFYTEQHTVDFCQIQIPVRKMSHADL